MATVEIDQIIENYWPTSLPGSPQSWSEQYEDNLITTQMDSGVTKVRRRWTGRATIVNVRWTLSKNAYEELDRYWSTTLQQGALPFQFPHPFTGEMVGYRFEEPPTVTDVQKGRAVVINCKWRRVT